MAARPRICLCCSNKQTHSLSQSLSSNLLFLFHHVSCKRSNFTQWVFFYQIPLLVYHLFAIQTSIGSPTAHVATVIIYRFGSNSSIASTKRYSYPLRLIQMGHSTVIEFTHKFIDLYLRTISVKVGGGQQRRSMAVLHVNSKLGQWGYFYPMFTYRGPRLLITLFPSVIPICPSANVPQLLGRSQRAFSAGWKLFPSGQQVEVRLTPEQFLSRQVAWFVMEADTRSGLALCTGWRCAQYEAT